MENPLAKKRLVRNNVYIIPVRAYICKEKQGND